MKILHISVHEGVDRRFIGMMNHSVRQGHDVAFLSLPIDLNGSGLDSRVMVVSAPLEGSGRKTSFRKRVRRFVRESLMRLPAWLSGPVYWRIIERRDSKRFMHFDAMRVSNIPDFVPDIVHVHDLRAVPYALAFRPCWSGVKIIYDAHEFTPFEWGNRKIKKDLVDYERKVVRSVDAVIAVNCGIAHAMARLYQIPEPEVLLNSAEPLPDEIPCTDGEFLRHFSMDDLDGNSVRVLFPGSITAWRNVECLIRAFDLLPPHIHLFVLGFWDMVSHMKEISGKNVHFGPPVSPSRLLGFTRHATFGVIPYLADRCLNNELCTPNKLFEFIEAGVPVCSSKLPEVERILSTDGNGACFSMQTPDEIAKAILTMCRRLEQGDFGREALDAARAKYSYASQMLVLDEIYRKLACAE